MGKRRNVLAHRSFSLSHFVIIFFAKLLMCQFCGVKLLEIIVKLSNLPADGTLAVGGSLGDGQRLAYLGLRQAQRKAAQLERLGELLDVVQVDAVHHVAVGLVDGELVWKVGWD